MKRSFGMGVRSSKVDATYMSWRRRASFVLAVLGAFYFSLNAWQSWHDFRLADLLAAQQLDTQAGLIARSVEDQVRALQSMTSTIGRMIETNTLSDASLDDLSGAFRGPLGHTLIGVFNPADGHLLASSRPEIISSLPLLEPFLARVRDNPSKALLIPVAWGERGAVVAVTGHQNSVSKLDAISVMIVSLEDPLFEEVNFAPGTMLLLRDSENRIVVRNPLPLDLTPGQVLTDEGPARPGPTVTTQYVESRIDDTYRLVSTRKVAVGLKPDHWTLSVGNGVSNYRASVLTSLYFNAAAAASLLALLAGGVWLIRRQHEFASTISAIVENVPTPVAVVDLASDRILLANEALLAEFGAIAGAGQPFASLFVDPAIWQEVRTSPSGKPIPMSTRDRTRYMQLRCTQLEFATESAPSTALLVALIDVTRQQLLVKKLRSEADGDPLTGLANRRHFGRVAGEAVVRARQLGTPLSVLALDLDLFKQVNDTYGHAAGDRVLQWVGQLLRDLMRDNDLAARTGGEEFAAMLLDTTLDHAHEVAERIRATIQNTPMVLENGQTLSLTVSIGIASYHPDESDLRPAIKRADAALYKAKQLGRNRVRIFEPLPPGSEKSA